MSYPNPWDSPEFFQVVKIGGRPVRATLIAIDGNKIEDEWAEQKPTGNSGATNIFKGTKPAGPAKLTFEAVDVADFEDLRELWELLAPKPGSGGSGNGATQGSKGSAAYGQGFVNTKSPASSAVSTSPEDLLKQAQQALAAVQSGANTAAATGTGGTSATSASTSAASQPNPGPKPPTLSLENGYFNYVGITSISRKSWDGPRPSATNSQIVILEVVTQKDPTPAAVGKSAPKTPDSQTTKQIAFGDIQDPATLANAAMAAAGAQ